MEHATVPHSVRFGVFEVDLRAGELRKGGLRIRLQEQPFQVLSMLLEQPGEVVTRAELQKKLWPHDTFVDFDHGVNTAINKIRQALGDTVETPRFVETVARRGYRFIAPVEVMPNDGKAQNGAADPTPSETAAHHEHSRSKRRIWWSIVAAWWPGIALVVSACAILGYWVAQPPPAPRVTQIVRLTHDRLNKGGILATDGTRVYFSEQSPLGAWMATIVLANGGETTTMHTSLDQAMVTDVSADGSEVLVKEVHGEEPEGKLWAVPSVGGSPRPLGKLVAREATWSPNGQKLLFLHESELFIAQADGSDPHKLLTLPGNPYFIRWSPDGRRITVSLADIKSAQVWEAMADGTSLHPVLPSWNFPQASCSGHWTPDGKYLLFDSFRDGPDEIWAMRERAGFFKNGRGTPVRLTQGPASFGRPMPSKDGKTIFAVAWEDDAELMRYDSRTQQYLPYLPGLQPREVDFTRDDRWVAYRGLPDSTLWRSKVDGTGQLQLTFPPMQAFSPHWSPDGERIAFVGRTSTELAGIYVVASQGGVAERLTPTELWAFDPTWSPDGRRLAFYGYSTMSDDALYILDSQTKQRSKVPGSGVFISPRWSPDGRYIAAPSSDSQKLALFDLATQKWGHLADAPVGDLSWSRDGRYVYFNVGGAQPAVLRIRISDQKVEHMADLRTLLPNPINWFGLGPDDSLLVLRGRGSADIYALNWEAP